MKLMYNTTSVASQDLSRAGDIDEACDESSQRKLSPREGCGCHQRRCPHKQSAAVPSHKGSPHQPQGIKTMHNNQ